MTRHLTITSEELARVSGRASADREYVAGPGLKSVSPIRRGKVEPASREASTTTGAVCVDDRLVKNEIESGIASRKLKRGENNSCSIVAFVERSAFGAECDELEVEVKSFTPGVRCCEEVHPWGSVGGDNVSKLSE